MVDVSEAVVAGDLEAVRALVASDPSVASARDEQGLSAIMQALYRGRDDIVAVLLAADPELDVFEASALGDIGRVAELLDEDAERMSAWSPDGFTPLHLAVFFGHPRAAELLLRRGADPEVVSRNPMTVRPLHSAVAGRNAEAVAVLVSSGVDVNAPSHGGFTPLLEAAQNGDRRIVELLLAAGADPAAALDGGKMASDLALAHGHPDVAAMLREHS
jgi:ankyrin repeat protein